MTLHCYQSQLTVSGGAGVELLTKPVDCLGCHLGGHVPVEGGRVAALLHVTQDILANCKLVLALLTVQSRYEGA